MARRWVCLEYCGKAAGPAESGGAADVAQAEPRTAPEQPPRHPPPTVPCSGAESTGRQGHSWVGSSPGGSSSSLSNSRTFSGLGQEGLVHIFSGKSGCKQKTCAMSAGAPWRGAATGGTGRAFKAISVKGMNDIMSCSQAKGTGNEKQKAEV